MITAIKPGGWVMVEDFEVRSSAADDADGPVFRTFAAMRQVAAAAGAESGLGLSLGRRLRARGLAHVGHEGRVHLCRGNGAAARLMRLNFQQLRDAILATGLRAAEFEAALARLNDEDFEWRSPTLWTAWGQRPALA
jgi:hypothetical protein